MHYELYCDLSEHASTEGLATTLEQAAAQVRQMSSLRAAHSMAIPRPGGIGIYDVRHGVVRRSGTDTPG